MPTQKDIEEFIRIWKQQCGEVLTQGEAEIKLKNLIYLITDMAKTLSKHEESPKKERPAGFMGFWTGE